MIIVSGSAMRRREAARAWLAEQRARDPLAALGLLVADLQAASDLLHPAVLAGEPPALFNVYRFTPELLARQLARRRLAAERVGVAPPLSLRALVGAVLHDERPRLSHFARAAETPGFARALTRTLDELRRHDVRADDLEALGAAGPELARLLRAYEAILADKGFVDLAGLMRLAAETPAPHPVLGRALLICDAPIGDPSAVALLRAVIEAGTEVSATVAAGDTRTVAALDVLGLHAKRETEQAEGALGRLQTRLFGAETLGLPPHGHGPTVTDHAAADTDHAPSQDEGWAVFSAPSAELECVEVARRILELARAGVRADRIAVLMRKPRPYVELLENALRRVEIPMYPATGVLQPDPAGRAFLLLLECALERLSAARFAEYLSLGQLPAGDDAVITPARWERLLGDASVVGHSLERWRTRLGGLRGELSLRLAELDDDSSGPALGIKRDLGSLHSLEEHALPLLAQLDGLPEAATWGEWIAKLVPLAHAALSRPTRVVEVLGELNPLAAAGPVDRTRVIEVLRDRLTELPKTPPTHRYGRVFVGTPDDVRGMRFHSVFVVGLAERSFPDKLLQDPVLRDDARRAIERVRAERASNEAARPPLATAEERRRAERLNLRLAVGAAHERVVLSYPRLDLEEGRPRVPSFYLLEAWRAVRGELPRFEHLVQHAAAAGSASLERPYPSDPQLAIDDQEFDLATLARAQRLRREDPTVDLGGYLAHLHGHRHLIEALRAFWKQSSAPFSKEDGLFIQTGAGRDELQERRLGARPYGVTALEKFADCPYQFYLSSVLRLRASPRLTSARDVEEATLSELTRGRIIHRAQYELLTVLRERGLLPVDEQTLPVAIEELARCFERVAAAVAAEIAPPVDVLWREQMQGLLRELRGWLEREAEAGARTPWVPERFEYSFGQPARADRARDPSSRDEIANVFGRYKLRGAIDLVERGVGNAVRITDFKTGRAPAESKMGGLAGGASLQRVLYGLAIEALEPDVEVQKGRLYYCTERGGYRELSVDVDERLRREAQQLLELVDDSIGEGRLLAVPREPATCERCEYLMICGRDVAERAREKTRQERDSKLRAWLRGLAQVRR
ncbi:MAG: PD-(D/E)XK nuclease family protein [Myxococcales bacterium]|nr:PD-(D/E)XK nuclease family protein [Myxococcales bacterium]